MPSDSPVAPRLLILAAAYVSVIGLGIVLGHWITEQLEIDIHLSPETDEFWTRIVLIALIAYVLLMALPFVPGVEIGLTLLVVFGAELALLVYLSTVASLTLSFLVGRLVPERVIVAAFRALRLKRAHAFVGRLESLSAEEKLRILTEASPLRAVGWLVRFRYVAIAMLLNLPGNFLLGGGGGIGLVAGTTRIFQLPSYLLTVVIATCPVPLAVTLADSAVR